MVLRLVVAEDSLLMREGIKSVLALDEELEVVGVCADYDGLIAAVNAKEPDAVITDIRMPPTCATLTQPWVWSCLVNT